MNFAAEGNDDALALWKHFRRLVECPCRHGLGNPSRNDSHKGGITAVTVFGYFAMAFIVVNLEKFFKFFNLKFKINFFRDILV